MPSQSSCVVVGNGLFPHQLGLSKAHRLWNDRIVQYTQVATLPSLGHSIPGLENSSVMQAGVAGGPHLGGPTQ